MTIESSGCEIEAVAASRGELTASSVEARPKVQTRTLKARNIEVKDVRSIGVIDMFLLLPLRCCLVLLPL